MVIDSKKILEYSTGKNYNDMDSSFSPLYSTIGLNLDDSTDGIGELWFNYNRACRSLWDKFLEFDARFEAEKSSMINAVFTGNGICGSLAFYDTDCFSFEISGADEVSVFASASSHLGRFWCDETNGKCCIFKGYSLNDIDARDPDSEVPLAVAVNVICGRPDEANGILKIENEDGRIAFNIAFAALDFDIAKLTEKACTDISVKEAGKASCKWIDECLGSCSFTAENAYESGVISRAALGLIQNLTKGQGNLKNHISSFPSRGSYPTHFLWDSCFQNLAYELMNPVIAKDAINCLLDNIRSDGKIGQFICSTWIRPHFSQPALVGWAALRYVKASGDFAFAADVLPKLEMNNRWWLTSRITPCGLICCANGLETGQDDSPRFDNGTTISVDMNSYLLNQMRCTSELFAITGNKEKAERWNSEADRFSGLIVKYLYDKTRNMFYDVTPDKLETVDVLCCSNLLPLWAGVNLSDEQKHGMIKSYLLNSEHFFGNVPFPSVAYSDTAYKPEAWWRGPTWLPIAYLMLETLEKYGYKKEMMCAAERLYSMILRDGDLREVFNSETGEGMCAYEQGWSCAVFLKLNTILKKK